MNNSKGKGWLVSNGFLKGEKYREVIYQVMDSARRIGLDLELKLNTELLVVMDGTGSKLLGYDDAEKLPSFAIFWNKDIRLARCMEGLGIRLYNSMDAIQVCDDKSATHYALSKAGIRMPKTIVAPMTYPHLGYREHGFLEYVMDLIPFPMIVKECFGSFGEQVFLVKNYEQLVERMLLKSDTPRIFQELIATSYGRDIRVQVVGDHVAACMYRYSDSGDYRANITNGAKMKKYSPTKEQVEMALLACRTIGLDFAGVDILFGDNDEPILCEVNSNAHIKNIFECTGVNPADDIIRLIQSQMCGEAE